MNLLSEARLRLPVRLKLAVVSAGLTFVILLLFAVVVGTFTVRRLNSSFDSELRSATASLADRIRLRPEPTVPEDLSAPPRPAARRSACWTAPAG